MNTSPGSAAAGAPTGAVDVDVLVVGAGITGIYQLYRALEEGFSALPPRGRRGSRRHLVLEPLSRGPLRLGELHLRLPLLEGPLRRLALARALRPPARDGALPQPRRGPLRPAAPHPLRRQSELGRVPRSPAAPGASWRAGASICGPASSSPPPGSSPCPTHPTSPGERTLPARRITPARGRPGRSTSRASAWPSSGPRRAESRSCLPSPTRWTR